MMDGPFHAFEIQGNSSASPTKQIFRFILGKFPYFIMKI